MLNCIQQHHLQSHSNELTNGRYSECLMMRSIHRWLCVHTQCIDLRCLCFGSSVFILYILLENFVWQPVNSIFWFRCIYFNSISAKYFKIYLSTCGFCDVAAHCTRSIQCAHNSHNVQCSVTIFQNVASIFLRIGGIKNVYIARMNKLRFPCTSDGRILPSQP